LSFARALGLSLNIKVLGIDTPTALHFSDPKDGLTSASGFAAYAAGLPERDAMPGPNYLRDADAKPLDAKLRGLPDLKIRIAQTSDIPDLAKLHAACFADAWNEPVLNAMLQTPGSASLIAISAEGPVGFLIYRAVGHEAEILSFGVDPNLRGRGAGRALIDALLAIDFATVFLEVAAGNHDAVKIYTRAGFKQVGLRKAYYAVTGEDALVLRHER
jgi:ribosomal-protein-alanine acetyltransferase